jgi:hypothetical protein
MNDAMHIILLFCRHKVGTDGNVDMEVWPAAPEIEAGRCLGFLASPACIHLEHYKCILCSVLNSGISLLIVLVSRLNVTALCV